MRFSKLRRISAHPYFPIIVLIVCNLLLGLVIGNDYGESWDENSGYVYAEQTLDAYAKKLSSEDLKPKNYGPFTMRYYGPFYYVVGEVFARMVDGLLPGWVEADYWHFIYFLAFQIAIFSFYYISLNLLRDRWAASGNTLLFTTQPLLWGHAFINPKDIPFMAFFLAAIAVGMRMVNDFVIQKQPHIADPLHVPRLVFADWTAAFNAAWAQASTFRKCRLVIVSVLILLPGVAFLLAGEGIDVWVAEMVSIAYNNPTSWLGQLFTLVAGNAATVSASAYVDKALFLLARIKRAYLGVAMLVIFILFVVNIFNPILFKLWESYLQPALKWLYKHIPKVTLFAGLLAGLCMSVRAYGFAAGGLVAIYYLHKARWRAIPALVAYFSVALLVMTLVWPYLWAAPLTRYYEVLTVLANFPSELNVLFNGHSYLPKDLPVQYLSTLMTIQFTEPVVILFVIGVVVAVVQAVRRELDRALVIGMALWFFVPFLMITFLPITVYDNFRQFLFIVPPIFLFAGLTLKAFLARIPVTAFKSLVIALVVLPGVFWGIRLHPYQYIYYNSFVGGVQGAAGRFEMDYWVTSYKDATEFLNESAPQNASVRVIGPETVFRMYARPDLAEVQDRYSTEGITEYDYALITSRYNHHLKSYVEAPAVYSVEVEGTVLAVVKKLP